MALGSGNPVKRMAVEKAFSYYFDASVVAVPVHTGVPPQPVGLGEVVRGAALRAVRALEKVDSAHFGVGVEAGLIEFIGSTGFIEVQIAVVAGRDGRASIGLSPGFELPPWIVAEMLKGAELSSVAGIERGRRDIGEHVGYIGVKTWGRVTRHDLTEQAVIMALTPWLDDPSWLVSVDELLEQASLTPKPRPRARGQKLN
ncbi:inosine/xanthosine triphosphatase [Stetteria hydrogenophila]